MEQVKYALWHQRVFEGVSLDFAKLCHDTMAQSEQCVVQVLTSRKLVLIGYCHVKSPKNCP